MSMIDDPELKEAVYGQCTGIFGANGSGKSTLYKMLVGEELPTQGTIKYCSGYSIQGYCPQFEGLDKYMTGREALTLFCTLRGMTANCIEGEVQNMLNMMGLKECENVLIGEYSGGTKRKLSSAIAIIACNVVLLDEPSAGMDPYSRRLLHATLDKAKAKGKTIIISSHSMDEFEKLCDNIAHTFRGTLKACNTVQKLMDEMGMFVTLTVKLKNTIGSES